MKSIKNVMDLQEMRKSSYQTGECECGVHYLKIFLGNDERGNERVVDPGKCDACIKRSVNKETQAIVEKTNKALLDREVAKYDPVCVIPPGCEEATFDNYNPENQTQQNALKVAREFAENVDVNTSESLMFQGTPGIGKSHLSVAMHKELRSKGIPTLIIDTPSFFQKLKSMFGYSDSGPAQEKLMKKLRNVEVLILDDIGAEYAKSDGNESWASDILYQIMNDRQTKTNVFSTNYTSKDLKQKYGNLSTRIISRMLAGAEVIKVEGKDQRMKGFE